MKAIGRMSPPHAGHSRGNSSPTRAMEYAAYRAIIDLAEAGRWEGAEREALQFGRDQQR